MTHKHRWHHAWSSSLATGFRCECGAKRERAATDFEKKMWKKHWKESTKRNKHLHSVWHDYMRSFIDVKKPLKGYSLMVAVEKWAKKYPKDVTICSVDDAYHAGSVLVLIQHKLSPRKVWGVTVVYIPQCTGENQINFFLYPCHYKPLAVALSKVA